MYLLGALRPLDRKQDMDVAQWLQGLGLAQYEQAFRDNAVDADTLPRLTSDDSVSKLLATDESSWTPLPT